MIEMLCDQTGILYWVGLSVGHSQRLSDTSLHRLRRNDLLRWNDTYECSNRPVHFAW